MDCSGPNPMLTVGNSQKSGMSHGCGYEQSPPPGFSSRRKFSSFSLGRRPSKNAREYMPGAACPWKYTTSRSPFSVRALRKWLNATSYRVAAEAYVEICPPIPFSTRFARTTMAIAFQRTRLLIRRSISWLPGKGAWCRDGIVFW